MMDTKQLPKALQTFVDPFHFRIFIDRNEGDWKMPFEWHEPLEIFYTLSGKGRYFIEDKIYTFEAGDLFVINNYELHKSQLIDGEPFEALIIMFNANLATAMQLDDGLNPLSLFYERESPHQLKTDSESRQKLETVFSQMKSEYEREEGFSLRSIAALLQWLLVELKRAYDRNEPLNSVGLHNSVHLKEVVSHVLEYIDKHYCEDIKLSQVAAELCVSPSYLSREFKKDTGFSLVEFISSKRIRLAREMLLKSNLQVTEIATRVGYNNVTHFHWTFKKMVGISPGQYRKMYKTYNRKQTFVQ